MASTDLVNTHTRRKRDADRFNQVQDYNHLDKIDANFWREKDQSNL